MARLLPGVENRTSSEHPGRMRINLRKTTELAPAPRSEGVVGAVGAELGAEGVADLADGGEVAEGLAHGGEEVVAAAGRLAEGGQGRLDGVGVAGGADVDQGLGLGVGDG